MRDEDVDASVTAGIVTAEQAQALRAYAEKREQARAIALGHEERFRFMSGFNDFFFAIGVVLLGAGMGYFGSQVTGGYLIAAAITWLLAELLVARMRLVLPGILLACFFVGFVVAAVPRDVTSGHSWIFIIGHPGDAAPVRAELAIRAITALVAAALYYARFRLPFALLLVAGAAVAAIMAATGALIGTTAYSLVLLACGLAVFAAAMAFDISDRERTTRRADCAFWLHLLAAPLIVHSLISAITPGVNFLAGGLFGLPSTQVAMSGTVAWLVVVIVLWLALVAVVIDRRALLVSTLSYLAIVITYALRHANGGGGLIKTEQSLGFATLALLGALVLTLGVGWMPLRRMLMKLVPSGIGRNLPPVPTGIAI